LDLKRELDGGISKLRVFVLELSEVLHIAYDCVALGVRASGNYDEAPPEGRIWLGPRPHTLRGPPGPFDSSKLSIVLLWHRPLRTKSRCDN
jgi:hypothetical protein